MNAYVRYEEKGRRLASDARRRRGAETSEVEEPTVDEHDEDSEVLAPPANEVDNRDEEGEAADVEPQTLADIAFAIDWDEVHFDATVWSGLSESLDAHHCPDLVLALRENLVALCEAANVALFREVNDEAEGAAEGAAAATSMFHVPSRRGRDITHGDAPARFVVDVVELVARAPGDEEDVVVTSLPPVQLKLIVSLKSHTLGIRLYDDVEVLMKCVEIYVVRVGAGASDATKSIDLRFLRDLCGSSRPT